MVLQNGRRHWWPISINPIDSVATAGFEIVTGAILGQNTTWKNAERALANMYSADIWGYGSVHDVPERILADTIRSSGYYNTKAKKLKAFAKVITTEFNGTDTGLFKLELSELRDRLLSIYGIGEETADDIILYAAKKPSFIIDTYTRRIVDRLGWLVNGNRYSDYQGLFADKLEPDVEMWGEFHAQLDGHAANVCQKVSPLCTGCVLLDLCRTGQHNIS